MLPTIVSPSELRRGLASFLDRAEHELIVIKGKEANRVIMNEEEFNRLTALANQFMAEDPEGSYRPEFEKEILKRSKKGDFDPSVRSLNELL